MSDSCHLLFVGGEINPLSIAVLDALAQDEELRITLFASEPARRGLRQTFRRTWDQHGPATIARGGMRLVRARTRLALRSAGLPLSGAGSLTELSDQRGIPKLTQTSINTKASVAAIREAAPDILLVAAFDQILKPRVLEIPRLGCLNVHPSLLPARRGPNPIYWAVAGGDARTGVTVHMIDEGIDTGDIVEQRALALAPGETEVSLLRRLASLSAEMVPEVVRGFRDGTCTPTAQPEQGASYDPQPPRGASKL